MLHYTEARLVWIPASIAARKDRFAVVRAVPPAFAREHNAVLASWGQTSGWWLGPGASDASMSQHGDAYVHRLMDLFVELTTDFGLCPDLVRRELSKIDLWAEHWSWPRRRN